MVESKKLEETKKTSFPKVQKRRPLPATNLRKVSFCFIALLYLLTQTCTGAKKMSQTCAPKKIFPALTIHVTLGNPGQYIGRHQFLHPGRDAWPKKKLIGNVQRFFEWITPPKMNVWIPKIDALYLYMGVSKNRGILPPKWMVKKMENPIKMDDLGVPLFLENTHIDMFPFPFGGLF